MLPLRTAVLKPWESLGILRLTSSVEKQTVTTDKITKHDVVSEIFKIFDPLGLFSPVVIKAKRFMQGLTKDKFEYNEELPTQLQLEWKQFREDLKMLNDIKIPRHVFDGKIPVSKEIHTFVDASENAHAAAIYLRAFHKDK